jgi:hypothetical protein
MQVLKQVLMLLGKVVVLKIVLLLILIQMLSFMLDNFKVVEIQFRVEQQIMLYIQLVIVVEVELGTV